MGKQETAKAAAKQPSLVIELGVDACGRPGIRTIQFDTIATSAIFGKHLRVMVYVNREKKTVCPHLYLANENSYEPVVGIRAVTNDVTDPDCPLRLTRTTMGNPIEFVLKAEDFVSNGALAQFSRASVGDVAPAPTPAAAAPPAGKKADAKKPADPPPPPPEDEDDEEGDDAEGEEGDEDEDDDAEGGDAEGDDDDEDEGDGDPDGDDDGEAGEGDDDDDEDDDEEDDDEDGIDLEQLPAYMKDADRSTLKDIAAQLKVTVKKSMSDDDIRAACLKAAGIEPEAEKPPAKPAGKKPAKK